MPKFLGIAGSTKRFQSWQQEIEPRQNHGKLAKRERGLCLQDWFSFNGWSTLWKQTNNHNTLHPCEVTYANLSQMPQKNLLMILSVILLKTPKTNRKHAQCLSGPSSFFCVLYYRLCLRFSFTELLTANLQVSLSILKLPKTAWHSVLWSPSKFVLSCHAALFIPEALWAKKRLNLDKTTTNLPKRFQLTPNKQQILSNCAITDS